MTRLIRRLAIAVVLAGAFAAQAQAQERFDLLIRGGLVFDGGPGEARQADVGVRGDRIVLSAPRRGTASRIR